MTTALAIEDSLWLVPVSSLAALCNPMEEDIWGCGKIYIEDVLACEDIRLGMLPAEMVPAKRRSWEYNVARIAWLMIHGWDENKDPISVDLYSDLCSFPVTDGNHRLSAAIILNLDAVYVSVSGDLDYCEEVLQPLEYY